MDRKLTQDMANRRAERRDLVKTADRSEKIRTYNYAQVCTFPRVLPLFMCTDTEADILWRQERVTDHRLGLSLMNLTGVIEGDGLNEFIDAMMKNRDETAMEEIVGMS